MSSEADRVSRNLQSIAKQLDEAISSTAGRPVAWTLLVYTEGRANYVSSASREESVAQLRELLRLWDEGVPDVPAHKLS